MYQVDDSEFRSKRKEFYKQLNQYNKDEKLFWQIPGRRQNKWLYFEDFSEVLFEMDDSLLRTPLNNEIIIDIDKKIFKEDGETLDSDKSINSSLDEALHIIDKFEKENIKYSLYFSGNKGFHIKVLIGSFSKSNSEVLEIMKLKQYGSEKFFKLMKEAFLKYFGFKIGINEEDGIDERLLIKKQLVRTEGSMHQKSEKWKTYADLNGVDISERKNYILNYITSCGNKTEINWNYLKETNNLNKPISDFIFDYVKENFEKELIREVQAPKYTSEFNKEGLIDKYIKVFKELYIPGQRYTVGGAVVSFLYWATEGDKQKSYQIYYRNFRNLSEHDAESAFQSRFRKSWEDAENTDFVSFYKVLENMNIITKQEFKEKVKNGK